MKIRNKTGETLLEVLIAVVILVLFLSSILAVINRAIFMNENIQNRVEAINLAREGIEGVRNIRDTNWLRFSGDKRNKWLCMNKECSKNIGESSYYRIELQSEAYELLPGEENSFADFYRLYKTTENIFTHTEEKNTPTIFYRQIKTKVLESPPRLSIIVSVFWQESNGEKSVSLETELFDYYKQNAY